MVVLDRIDRKRTDRRKHVRLEGRSPVARVFHALPAGRSLFDPNSGNAAKDNAGRSARVASCWRCLSFCGSILRRNKARASSAKRRASPGPKRAKLPRPISRQRPVPGWLERNTHHFEPRVVICRSRPFPSEIRTRREWSPWCRACLTANTVSLGIHATRWVYPIVHLRSWRPRSVRS